MKIPCYSFFAAALLVGVPLAISGAPQTSTASQSGSQGASGQDQIAPGSLIPVELAKTIDAKKAKQGDPVVAKIPGELRDNAGQVAIPAGAKVVGHVTEAKAREKGESQSMLGIAWDKIVLKDGHEIPLTATIIQAVAAPPSRMAAGGYGPMSESGGMPGSTPGQPAGGMAGGMSRPAGAPSETGTSSRSNTGNTAGGTDNPSGAASGAQLTPTSQGVLGMEGLSLAAGTNGQGAVISSEKKNVKLESGTRMLLRVGS
jgi:hypothetical protein